MQGQDTRIFNGVMDQDSAPFTIDQSNVRYRLNLVNLYNENGFASNENIQGFEVVSNSYLSGNITPQIPPQANISGMPVIQSVLPYASIPSALIGLPLNGYIFNVTLLPDNFNYYSNTPFYQSVGQMLSILLSGFGYNIDLSNNKITAPNITYEGKVLNIVIQDLDTGNNITYNLIFTGGVPDRSYYSVIVENSPNLIQYYNGLLLNDDINQAILDIMQNQGFMLVGSNVIGFNYNNFYNQEIKVTVIDNYNNSTEIYDFPYLNGAPETHNKNKCIGAFEDVRGNSIIYFVWSEDGKDGIFRWYQNKGGLNGTIEKVYQGSVLDFEEYHRISHCSLVDDLLTWTDGVTSPKCINIARANTTGKQRVFNLYFDDNSFNLATNYTLTVYASTTITLTWTSNATSYVGRVNDLVSAANSNLLFNRYAKIIDKVNYVQVQLLEVGDYMIEVNPSCYVVAENFYPDVTPTPYSYTSLNEELITTVKYPPFKAPSVGYINATTSAKKLRVQYQYTQTNAGDIQIGWLGMNNNSTGGFYDTIGISNLGVSNLTSQGSPFSIPAPLSYFENTTGANITVSFNLSVTLTAGVTGGFQMFFGKYVGSSLPLPNQFTIYPNSAGLASKSVQFTATLAPGEKWGLVVFSANTDVTLYCIMDAVQVEQGVSFDIINNAYQFRAKYVYIDNEVSVYGAISSIPCPVTYFDDSIEIDYTDPRLSSLELVSQIKEVVLSYSKDNGTTWYDFKRLTPLEFVTKSKWVFNETQVGIASPSSSTILPYHNIPLTAKTQEFVDDRLFYGAVKTGYDKVEVDLSFAVSFTLLDDISELVNSLPPLTSTSYWRRGGEYLIGVVYYDDADRRTGVCLDIVNSRVKVPLIASGLTSFDKVLAPASISWTINNQPPSWATKYQFVRTKDLTQDSYLMFTCDKLEQVDDEGNVVVSGGTYIKISFANIPYYLEKTNIGSKIAFPYVDGDRLKFITDLPGGYFDNDHKIVKVDGTDVYIKNEGLSPVTGSTSGGAIALLYTPSTSATDSELFYEFSECFEVSSALFSGVEKPYHKGLSSNQSYSSFPSISSPATGVFRTGDVFYRTRIMPFKVYNAPVISTVPYFISSNTPNEDISDTFYNNGRVNSTELLGQVYQPTGVVFTNRYISGTKINGLNAVEAANTRQYSTIYGDLNKMQVVNNDVLKFIFGNGYQLSIYVNQGVIRQTGGASNLISIYDDVAGNSHLIQRTLGTQNAESVVLNDEGDVFGWDETEGVDWLSASNATLQVSDYNMKNTFGNYGLQRRRLDNTKSNTPAIYDLYRDLMILTLAPLQPRQFVAPKATVKLADLDDISKWTIEIQLSGSSWSFSPTSVNWYDIVRATIPNSYSMTQNADGSFDISSPYINETPILIFAHKLTTGRDYTYTYPFTGGQEASNEPPFSGVTLAYSRKLKGWVTYFSYLPEMYGRLRNQVASFKDGQLWLHDKSVLSNNFYGVQYPSLLRFVLNKDYPKVKVPLSVWYRGLGSWGSVVRYQPDNMETEMIPAAFRLQENGYAASVTRDRNDPRFTDPQQAWVNGQEVRGDAVEIELYNNDSSQARIDSEKTVYLHSNLS